MHADVGVDQQIELVVADLLQHRLGVLGLQRQMPVGAQGSKALTAGILGFGEVVAVDLVTGLTGDALQPAESPDRAVVVDQMR